MNKRHRVAARRGAKTALVSIIIPTYNRPELLLRRSIPSVLAQTHERLDLHVVGDGAIPEVVEAMRSVTDPRVRFTNRPRPEYPPGELDAWHVSGSYAVNYGLDTVKGQFVCVLGDDDEQRPEFVEAMLEAIVTTGSGGAWCASEIIGPHGFVGYLGIDEPLQFARQSGGEFMWRRNAIRLDPECWKRGAPNDWDYVSRMLASGVTFTHVRRALYRYFPARHIPGGYPRLPW